VVNLANVLPVNATMKFVENVSVKQSEDWIWTVRVIGRQNRLRIAMAYLDLPGTSTGLFMNLYVVLPNGFMSNAKH
jgi:hypothetical protein